MALRLNQMSVHDVHTVDAKNVTERGHPPIPASVTFLTYSSNTHRNTHILYYSRDRRGSEHGTESRCSHLRRVTTASLIINLTYSRTSGVETPHRHHTPWESLEDNLLWRLDL